MAARGVISKDVHLVRTRFALAGQRGTRERLAEQRHAQAKLEIRAKDIGLQVETQPGDRRRDQPVTGVRHCATQHQVLRAHA